MQLHSYYYFLIQFLTLISIFYFLFMSIDCVISCSLVNGLILINVSDGEMFKEISMLEMFITNWQENTSFVPVPM